MTIDAQQILDAISKLSDLIHSLTAKLELHIMENEGGFQKLTSKLDQHIVENEDSGKKVADTYKILVTGNGVPSFQERVRNIETWIKYEKYALILLFGGILADIGMRAWSLIINK